MAAYTGDKTVHGKTLVGSTADTVTLTGDFTRVRVLNLTGTDRIYFTVDQTTAPTVAGDGTSVLPAAISSKVAPSSASQGTVVRLISAGTPTYSVEGV